MREQIMYTPFSIGKMEVKNRLVASAMFEAGAKNGQVTEKIVERYRQLAEGGVGLIITGMQGITASATVAPSMVHTEYTAYEEDMKKLAAIVHAAGCKLIVQLQHCGSRTLPMDGFDHFSVCETVVSDTQIYHEATQDEIKKVVTDFGKAALRCKAAGVDGVQIHSAHGFLLNSFLSPSSNHRTDEYGGDIQNRARFLLEIYDEVRSKVGNYFIVGIKFPFNDLNTQSISPEDSLYVCRELEQRGIDFIEVSSGMGPEGGVLSFSPIVKKDAQAPFLKYAETVANAVSIPIISVCGYRSPDVVEKVLSETKISAISFGRPLVCEPNLPNRWKTNGSAAKCISCNRCGNSYADGIITCQVQKERLMKSRPN